METAEQIVRLLVECPASYVVKYTHQDWAWWSSGEPSLYKGKVTGLTLDAFHALRPHLRIAGQNYSAPYYRLRKRLPPEYALIRVQAQLGNRE